MGYLMESIRNGTRMGKKHWLLFSKMEGEMVPGPNGMKMERKK